MYDPTVCQPDYLEDAQKRLIRALSALVGMSAGNPPLADTLTELVAALHELVVAVAA